MASVKAVNNEGDDAAEKVVEGTWVEALARFGYATRGVLYIVVGLLAVQMALGQRGATEGKTGALDAINAQPFGKFLLILVVIGLVGYSLWGLVRALLDPLRKGSSPKGIPQRIGYLVSAVSYGALVLPAIRLIMGSGSAQSGGGNQNEGSATIMAQPWGPWAIGLVGLIAMAGAIGQFYTGWSAKFKKDFKTEKMNADELKFATRVGQIGHMARGVVFLLLGFFLVQAALHTDPNKIQGLDGALATLARQPYGPILLGVVAFGLIAFGVYSILCTKWIQVIKPESAKKD